MKPATLILFALTGTLAYGEPPAREAAPEARQAAPIEIQIEGGPEGIKRPIIRCGVGEVVRPVQNTEQAMKAFPAPDKGMARFVAELPKLDEENAFKVEIIVGKTVEVDTANRHFFAGRIEAENIQGWGYTRYIVRELGPMAGTLRARIGGAQKEERFITLGGEPYLVRYNSRLPLVVYAPEGAEVKFRVWNAGERTIKMEKK